jgi:hypothetical protein
MSPKIEWVEDWGIGIDVSTENRVSQELLVLFNSFWIDSSLVEKSKTTKSRYRSALHALGGYIVEQAVSHDNAGKSGIELLIENIKDDESPLIYHDEGSWQNELDMVCRKLFKYINEKC